MLTSIRKLRTFLDRRSQLHLYLLFLPMTGVAILEMASIGMILPFIQVLVAPDSAGPVSDFIEWLLPDVPVERRLIWIAVIFSSLFVVKNISLFLMFYFINRIIQRKLAQFLQRLFALYLNRPFAFHLQRNSAEIVRNLSSSASRSFETIRLLLMMSLELLLMTVAFGVLLYFEPVVTLAAGAILMSFGLAFHFIAGPHFARWGRKSLDLEGRIIKSVHEALGSIRDVKLLHIQDYLGKVFARHTNGIAKYNTRLSTSLNIPRLSIETVIVVGFAVVVISTIQTKGSVEEVISVLGLFGMAALRLMPSMNRILSSAAEVKNRLASIDVLYTDFVEARKDSEHEEPGANSEAVTFKSEIRLENVSFSYSGASAAAIRNIDLTIKAGESVGIVGPNGAGKSTLLDILLGLLRPNQGAFSVDGENIHSNPSAWQKHLGYVPQNIYLIDDTLKRNIAFGIEDAAIDPNRLDAAMKRANLGPVVETLADGLDTRLNEGGSRLSGGQRQRVAITRALYRDPDVLIFDEATSALDNETEREIVTAIDRLKGHKTVIIITQKLSLVRGCDKIIFMRDGEIVDVGRFDDLVVRNERFRGFVGAGEQLLVDDVMRKHAE